MNKKRLIYIISSVIVVIILGVGLFFCFNNKNSDNYSGTTTNTTNVLPTNVTEIVVDKKTPQTEGKKAALQTADTYNEFDTIREAYDLANTYEYTKVNTTLIFFDNWIAEGEYGFFAKKSEKFENIGYEDGGELCPAQRYTMFTIDLNGYTLGRKLDAPMANGGVVNIANYGNITIKNGYITGGNTTGCGGGIYIRNIISGANIYLTNVHIRNNYAAENGGGIYTGYYKTTVMDFEKTNLYIEDCSIYNNTAGNFGGGVFSDLCEAVCDSVNIKLSKKVVIFSNSSSKNKNYNNLTLRQYERFIQRLDDVTGLTEGSNIYLGFSMSQDESDITFDYENKEALDKVVGYFHSDESNKNIIVNSNSGYHNIRLVKKSGC